jgi:hypothetical protein
MVMGEMFARGRAVKTVVDVCGCVVTKPLCCQLPVGRLQNSPTLHSPPYPTLADSSISAAAKHQSRSSSCLQPPTRQHVNMPPKSILKKNTTTTTTTTTVASINTPPGKKPVNPRHLEVAVHHANVLEDRKRVEAAVLDSIITLLDFPTATNANPKRPSALDARRFREAMIPFQPADYDALIEERNISDRCGYALCPNPKRKARSIAKKQFVDTENGVEIVDRKVLEVWCSDDCAKRALYVKVQLKEEPAWMRQGGYGDNIELMVENAEEHHVSLPLRLKQDDAAATEEEDELVSAWAAREDAMTDLALERGEKPGQLTKANHSLIQGQITERAPSNAPPQPPSLPSQTSDHTMAIEGHVPRTDRREREDEDDEDEDDAQDWDKHLPG